MLLFILSTMQLLKIAHQEFVQRYTVSCGEKKWHTWWNDDQLTTAIRETSLNGQGKEGSGKNTQYDRPCLQHKQWAYCKEVGHRNNTSPQLKVNQGNSKQKDSGKDGSAVFSLSEWPINWRGLSSDAHKKPIVRMKVESKNINFLINNRVKHLLVTQSVTPLYKRQ